MCRIISVRDRLLYSAIWPTLLGVLGHQTVLFRVNGGRWSDPLTQPIYLLLWSKRRCSLCGGSLRMFNADVQSFSSLTDSCCWLFSCRWLHLRELCDSSVLGSAVGQDGRQWHDVVWDWRLERRRTPRLQRPGRSVTYHQSYHYHYHYHDWLIGYHYHHSRTVESV